LPRLERHLPRTTLIRRAV